LNLQCDIRFLKVCSSHATCTATARKEGNDVHSFDTEERTFASLGGGLYSC
jgi:hypothetical protein